MTEKEPIPLASNFIRAIVDKDLENGVYDSRKWAGTPGDAAHHATGQPDHEKIRTRFPPNQMVICTSVTPKVSF